MQILTEETCHVCGAPMVMKFSRTGRFLGCSKYPECKATRPIGGQPRAEAVESEHACPKCGKPLMIRENKRGETFLSCSGYPECKESFNIDEAGNPVPSVVETEYVCEKCGKPMVMRQGPRGDFLGCTGLSQVPQHDAGRRAGQARPAGQGRGHLREVRRPDGRARKAAAARSSAAPNYPKCRGTAPIPDELKEQLAEQAGPPRRSPGPDLKTIAVEETCEQCGGPMIVRRSRRGFFLGCAKYPKCKGHPRSPARRPSPRSTPPSVRDLDRRPVPIR